VDLVDEVPVGLAHLLERDVAQDAGVVDEDVDRPKASTAVLTMASPFSTES
jgi:hypothetical protein